MAISVNVKENPLVANIALATGLDVTISSGESANSTVTYQIQQRDGQSNWSGSTTGKAGQGRSVTSRRTISLISTQSVSGIADVTSITGATLNISLKHRTRYRVRIRVGSGAWSAWFEFKTRDKHYKTPDSITQEIISDEANPQELRFPNKKVKKRIVITNNAKSSVTTTARGATVTNSDLGYIGTTSITATSAGATVVNDNYYAQKKAGGRGPAARQPR